MKEFEKGEWPENKVFWVHVGDANLAEEIPIGQKREFRWNRKRDG